MGVPWRSGGKRLPYLQKRHSMKEFPKGFVWGASTSAYQIEGAYNIDGKGPSIWDAFSSIPGKTNKGETGQVSGDHYHRFREDVALMKEIGLKAYRFSISWPRVMPAGKGEVNKKGIQFYSDLIDALLDAGITPWPTLFHWDMPLALQMENDGWIGAGISDYFAAYADVCFEHFGGRVRNWITLNEPWVTAILGYGLGHFAPGRVSNAEPYLAGHNQILAHAKAVAVYRKKYAHQGGQIGMANNCDWREPLTDSPQDKAAAQRALEFFLAWFADPLYFGDYPAVMKERLGERLPEFTEVEKELVKGSADYFGLNHYTTMYAAGASGASLKLEAHNNAGLAEDQDVELSQDDNWKRTSMGWAVAPRGCRKLLEWIDERYGRPDIYLTENGSSWEDHKAGGKVADPDRIEFYRGYLEACHKAIEKGVRLKGYFAWSLMDNFEWAHGYSKRFGLIYIDYRTLERTLKDSAYWYAGVIGKNGV